jgi:hypothetical protein
MKMNICLSVLTYFDSNFKLIFYKLNFPHEMLSTIEVNHLKASIFVS